jgi:hypothetical protein
MLYLFDHAFNSLCHTTHYRLTSVAAMMIRYYVSIPGRQEEHSSGLYHRISMCSSRSEAIASLKQRQLPIEPLLVREGETAMMTWKSIVSQWLNYRSTRICASCWSWYQYQPWYVYQCVLSLGIGFCYNCHLCCCRCCC